MTAHQFSSRAFPAIFIAALLAVFACPPALGQTVRPDRRVVAQRPPAEQPPKVTVFKGRGVAPPRKYAIPRELLPAGAARPMSQLRKSALFSQVMNQPGDPNVVKATQLFASVGPRVPFIADKAFIEFAATAWFMPDLENMVVWEKEIINVRVRATGAGQWYLFECFVHTGATIANFTVAGPDGSVATLPPPKEGGLQFMMVAENANWHTFQISRPDKWGFNRCDISVPAP